jgi:hypothetical protein
LNAAKEMRARDVAEKVRWYFIVAFLLPSSWAAVAGLISSVEAIAQ